MGHMRAEDKHSPVRWTWDQEPDHLAFDHRHFNRFPEIAHFLSKSPNLRQITVSGRFCTQLVA